MASSKDVIHSKLWQEESEPGDHEPEPHERDDCQHDCRPRCDPEERGRGETLRLMRVVVVGHDCSCEESREKEPFFPAGPLPVTEVVYQSRVGGATAA